VPVQMIKFVTGAVLPSYGLSVDVLDKYVVQTIVADHRSVNLAIGIKPGHGPKLRRKYIRANRRTLCTVYKSLKIIMN